MIFLYNEFSHALDEGKEVRTVFFDISKAFDRVWHKGLLFKIESLGIKGNLLLWVKSYLSGRKQRVVINGKQSTLLELKAGVPQGFILRPLFFLIFITDIVNDIGCRIKLFADDTSLYIIIDQPDAAAQILNEDLEKVRNWTKTWLVSFNPRKTETLLISRKANQIYHPPLYFYGIPIQELTNHKHLGFIFNNTCHWGQHIDNIVNKAYKKLNILRSLKFDLDRLTLQIIFFFIYCGWLYFRGCKITHSWGSKFVAIAFSLIIHTENCFFVGTKFRGYDPPRKPLKLVPHEN